MSDNEVLVLIYETMQKQLGQMKDSRVVLQSLNSRVSDLEALLQTLNDRTDILSERLAVLENAMDGLDKVNSSNKKLYATVNAMRGTLDTVTNPSITMVADTHKSINKAIRDLTTVHAHVMDEFEQYELRLAKTEDAILKILTNQVLPTSSDNEDK